MNIQFYAKNVDLTQQIKDYVNDKIAGLVKYDSGLLEAQVDISKDTHHQKGCIYRFEVNTKSTKTKKIFRAEATGENIMEAIDLVKDKLHRQISKMKK